MKKLLAAMMCVAVFALPAAGASTAAGKKDAGAATVLSLVFSGAGEWYNSDYKGSFPWGECILGEICCFVKLSSAFDAAAGKADQSIRLDFWSAPN